MRYAINSVFIFIMLTFIFLTSNAGAELNKYLYPYEISELDWQLLQWTSAWHESQDQFSPFKFDRMEYKRKTKKVEVYFTGLISSDIKADLNLALQKISNVFSLRFSSFEPKKDLKIFYRLSSEDKSKTVNIEYNEGSFYSQGITL